MALDLSVFRTLPLHTHQVVAAFLAYSVTFWIFSPVASTKLFAPYREFSRQTRIRSDVRVVSLIQATFISACAFYVIRYDTSRVQTDARDRLMAYSPMAGRVQAFAAGYFLWDLVISVLYYNALGIGSLVHAVCALGVTILGFYPFANYYGINLILYEVSNPFLNIHWFLEKANMAGTTWQWINGFCLLTAFFCFRVIWGFYQSFLLYLDIWTLWTSSEATEGDLKARQMSHERDELNVWLALGFLVANTVLSSLNIYWFGLIQRKFFGRLKGKGKAERGKGASNGSVSAKDKRS